ncbi:MAG: ChbG/HpnK family deacetylase [Gammaproteobacteria bacterium]|nr:ChbG/HpnK family deacetylase [Gammaproteobacteria bacterium]
MDKSNSISLTVVLIMVLLGTLASHAQATFAAMHRGSVNSGNIMVPCPWFPAAAAHYPANPSLDLGFHLTLNAEWRDYKWQPLPLKCLNGARLGLLYIHTDGQNVNHTQR